MQKNTVQCHLYVKSKSLSPLEAKSRLMITKEKEGVRGNRRCSPKGNKFQIKDKQYKDLTFCMSGSRYIN